jgi:nitrogen fixation/metabolism regulation signal transduction histidine kinase
MDPWFESFARTSFRRSSDTAHDLKTPLNVAVLNLELLRMRIAKLGSAGDDEKIAGYMKAIEAELRRMAQIFDTFFLLSTPPKEDEPAEEVDVCALCCDAGEKAGFEISPNGTAPMHVHSSRIRQAFKMFFEGASKVMKPEGRRASAATGGQRFEVAVSGEPLGEEDFEVTKLFKFYYTDPLGNPDLSLAAARLITETYGGELNASVERDKVILRLAFPLGDR